MKFSKREQKRQIRPWMAVMAINVSMKRRYLILQPWLVAFFFSLSPHDSSSSLSTEFKGIWTVSFKFWSFISTVGGFEPEYVTLMMLRNNLCESIDAITFFTVTFSKYCERQTLLVATNLQVRPQLPLYTLLDNIISSVFHEKNVFAFPWLMETKAVGGDWDYILFIVNFWFNIPFWFEVFHCPLSQAVETVNNLQII